jgi:predicted kinase
MKNPTLTLMGGIPRSGKSTWIEKNKTSSDVIVSPDEIRKQIFGHKFFKPAEPFIWSFTDSFILLLAQQKKDIILDAVNMSYSIRNKYITLVKKYGYRTKFVWINTDLKECLKRNKTSKDKKVPIDVIKSIGAVFCKCNLQYENEWDEIIEVRNGKTIKLK